MKPKKDARLIETRNQALESALKILQNNGILAVTHASISKDSGISRSTLYRHWPEINQLRNDAFKRAAAIPVEVNAELKGSLRADLAWLLSMLLNALNETPWGKVAPQVIAIASNDQDARKVISDFMNERITYMEKIFYAADARGELQHDVPIRQLVELTIAVPYFRKFMFGTTLDFDWLECHVDLICRLAEKPK